MLAEAMETLTASGFVYNYTVTRKVEQDFESMILGR